MPRLLLLLALFATTITAPALAAPTPAQLCESAIELASAKYAQCRLNAESRFSKTLDAGKHTDTLARCSQILTIAFAKANAKYGVNCAVIDSSSAFDDYLKQCSDDATAAAAGAALPDYVGELASCSADLSTCNGDLATCDGDLTACDGDLATCNGDLGTCTTDLATTEADLTTCEGDLATCEASPPALLLKTGQTTSYGAGTDGDLQLGVAQGYVDNGDGTITDTKTGLMWEKKSDDGSIHDKDNQYAWSTGSPWNNTGTAFTTFLATLNSGGGFAGHTDWRLPNVTELETITNRGAVLPAVSSAFNSSCGAGCTVLTCSCILSSSTLTWSSSSNVNAPGNAWLVNFFDGTAYTGPKTDSYRVRAVRGGS